jgi:hypothetical protein
MVSSANVGPGQPAMVSRDEEHLRLLSIFHYVVGGIKAVFACIPIIHILIGVIMLAVGAGTGSKEGAFPAVIGGFFAFIGTAAVLFGWTIAGLVLYAGRCLARKEHHTFCVVIAALNCLFVPFGTVLGVFTLIVLVRPSVVQLFEARRRASAAPERSAP